MAILWEFQIFVEMFITTKDIMKNCLVTLVTLGVVREDHIIHSYAPKNAEGYDLILIGKPTDNSGFGGASFASLELEETKKEQNKGAVQEPNAFLERHLLKSTYALFNILKGEVTLLIILDSRILVPAVWPAQV